MGRTELPTKSQYRVFAGRLFFKLKDLTVGYIIPANITSEGKHWQV